MTYVTFPSPHTHKQCTNFYTASSYFGHLKIVCSKRVHMYLYTYIYLYVLIGLYTCEHHIFLNSYVNLCLHTCSHAWINIIFRLHLLLSLKHLQIVHSHLHSKLRDMAALKKVTEGLMRAARFKSRIYSFRAPACGST